MHAFQGIAFTAFMFLVKEQGGSDVERDPARVVCFPPARLNLPSDSPVVQIATGLHHTVLLLQNGQVTTHFKISKLELCTLITNH